MRSVPQGFTIGKATMRAAWELWFMGQPNEEIPPYRYIFDRDLPTRKDRKILSEWRCAIKQLSDICRRYSHGSTLLSTKPMTHEVVEKCFRASIGELEAMMPAPKKNKRRWGELSVVTVIKQLRIAKRTTSN